MKTSCIVLSCSLATSAATTYAASCSPLEDAEIKDATSQELLKTYCYYDGRARTHQDAQKRLNELFLQQIKTPGSNSAMLEELQRAYMKTDADQAANLRNCVDQREKIGTVLRARRLPSPQCDAPRSTSK